MAKTKTVIVHMGDHEKHTFSGVTQIVEDNYKYKIYRGQELLADLNKYDVRNLITEETEETD